MKILYGTGNPAKIADMKRRLARLRVEIIGLDDIGACNVKILEDGNSPLENARKKALCYYKEFGVPVFSCDSGLYIKGIPKELQPGVNVRNIGGRRLDDIEMIEYYGGLAEKYGDLRARYYNAVCFVLDNEHIYDAMDENMASDEFIITSKPHNVVNKGFPLDSISVDINTGRYYSDKRNNDACKENGKDGFLEFFERIFLTKEGKVYDKEL